MMLIDKQPACPEYGKRYTKLRFADGNVYLLFMYMIAKQWKGSKSKLPPEPKVLPLIGNIHQLIGSSFPHHALRELAKNYGPVMHLKLGELTAIITSSPEAAEAALKTHELSLAQRPLLVAEKAMSYDRFGAVFPPYANVKNLYNGITKR
ncbi:hypothetical protein RJ640_007706 [Escallonia rubra]|uniref:Cytochrome P450 n=1 Tax=Escallonia rubra TaxID=112253 RepID=A0AA88RF85_9ASTE|nr:hypothetical protein RJ640_007706 [Escallonia rubra]